MSDPVRRAQPSPAPGPAAGAAPDRSPAAGAAAKARADAFLCDRCGDEMFRMHAVWRCPGCGFKTDCCGW